MAPTLKGIHLVDDPEIISADYAAEVLWDGLGLLPFSVAPHYRSNHPESALIDKAVEFFIEHKMPFLTLRDGEVHIVT